MKSLEVLKPWTSRAGACVVRCIKAEALSSRLISIIFHWVSSCEAVDMLHVENSEDMIPRAFRVGVRGLSVFNISSLNL